MKKILCFGDSNTWGRDPSTSLRFPKNVRWTGILAEHLGKDFEVIEEGLPGRTTIFNDPVEGKTINGRRYLAPCLKSHAPLDLVIFMLGMAELKKRFSLSPSDVARGMEMLIEDCKKFNFDPSGQTPEVLLLCPPFFGPGIEEIDRYEGAVEKMSLLPSLYQEVAEKQGCLFLETPKYVAASDIDNLHLDAAAHKKLAVAISAMVTKIFK